MTQVLLPAKPHAANQHRPVVAPLVDLEPRFSWVWMADHLDEPQPVTGGRPQARLLVRAIDGVGWPWTTIGCESTGRTFQVIGTFEACVLEIRDAHPMMMVARAGTPGPWQHMPAGAQHWVRRARTTELFTAVEAAEIGIGFLCGRPMPAGLQLNPVHITTLDTRK